MFLAQPLLLDASETSLDARRHTLSAARLLCDFLLAVDPLIVQISFCVRARVPLFCNETRLQGWERGSEKQRCGLPQRYKEPGFKVE